MEILTFSRFERAGALKSVHENSFFAPLGLDHFPLVPTSYAVDFIILSSLSG
jgi:hypothetical protein